MNLFPMDSSAGCSAAENLVLFSSKKVRWGKVQVKLFNKHASPADGKGNTVSFMGGGAARGGKGKQGGRGGRGGGGRGGGRQQNNNRRKAVSYF
jgi:hypothetical protein